MRYVFITSIIICVVFEKGAEARLDCDPYRNIVDREASSTPPDDNRVNAAIGALATCLYNDELAPYCSDPAEKDRACGPTSRQNTWNSVLEQARDQAARARKAAADQRAHEAWIAMERARKETQIAEQIKARDDAEAAAFEHENRKKAIHVNPKAMGIIFGAEICEQVNRRAEAIAEIRKEKKYARIGGYEDKRSIYELQQTIRASDEYEAEARKKMSSWKGHLQRVSCGNRDVINLMNCHINNKGCDEGDVSDWRDVLAESDDE